jgi:hypothetical protein
MHYSPSLDRLYTPYLAGWWLGMVVWLHWWTSFAGAAEAAPQRTHLRLVTDRGRLVEHP